MHRATNIGLLFCVLSVGACSSKDVPVTVDQFDGSTPITDATAEASAEAGVDPDAEVILAQGQIDRVGRSLTKLLLVSADKRADFNAAEPNDLTAVAPFGADFQKNLGALDALDGPKDWPALPDAGALTHPLGSALILDTLLIDTSKPFSDSGYLDLERELAGLGAHTTCGGRWLADDDVDKTFSLLVKKASSGVSDGVSAATKAPSMTFPYLAPPN